MTLRALSGIMQVQARAHINAALAEALDALNRSHCPQAPSPHAEGRIAYNQMEVSLNPKILNPKTLNLNPTTQKPNPKP